MLSKWQFFLWLARIQIVLALISDQVCLSLGNRILNRLIRVDLYNAEAPLFHEQSCPLPGQKTFKRAINNGLITTRLNKGDPWGMAIWMTTRTVMGNLDIELHVSQTLTHLWRLANHVVLQMCEYCLFSRHVGFCGPVD